MSGDLGNSSQESMCFKVGADGVMMGVVEVTGTGLGLSLRAIFSNTPPPHLHYFKRLSLNLHEFLRMYLRAQ